MMKQAVVRGEIHISNHDRKALLDRDLTNFQALYMEGRSDCVTLHKYTNTYMLFLIGYFSLELIYITTGTIHKRLLPFWHFDIKKEAQNMGLRVEDQTDLEIHEIYENVGARIIGSSLVIWVFAFFLTFWQALFKETLDLVIISTPIPYWILPIIIAILFPLGYFALLITFGGEERDAKMADTIDKDSDKNGYDGVLILVGDEHVEPIGDELQEQGWEVQKERSTHFVARAGRLIK